ncbi:trypsin-like serine peptidase [Streptomyces flavofungini]|uniref:trypsin-like serine peptidase n=1 Tax=Streptomyces flavofungini TaxID=68200 RepID=UPI0025AF762E|nr:hypothetical protein [Streptomyces flavofungini]WJV48941.1 hypothetical protein QUY26_27540 [Streptomyces flavofungini]
MATLLVLGLGGPAASQPSAEPPSLGSDTVEAVPELSDGTDVDTVDAAQSVEKYWTPERMENAIPADAPSADASDPSMNDDQEDTDGTPESTPPAPPVADAGDSIALEETSSVGKVFYTKSDGKEYACSASAVNSPSKQMVVTAGHCVNEGGKNGRKGKWVKNWTYVPQYRAGARPHGTFAAKEFRAFNGWIEKSNLHWDLGMVTTWPRNGKKLINVTGGNGLSYNYSRNQSVTAWGYPINRDFGRIQWWCKDTTKRVGLLDGRIEIDCNFGGGVSGGPWLREYNASTGLGYINGVFSTTVSTGWNRSPYFGKSVHKMFKAQGSET